MDLICYSHLRWNFVYQRPQHLISRFAKNFRTFYVEEPIFNGNEQPFYTSEKNGNVNVIIPLLSKGLNETETIAAQKEVLSNLVKDYKIQNHMAWYYTPMAFTFSRHLRPEVVVYDCMDELSNFKFAPPGLTDLESELLGKADVVFTGGISLYEAKKKAHKNIYAFPSSIDKAHFAQARSTLAEPEDQVNIPHPRFGFYGVIDERFDLSLLKTVAEQKPNWHFVILGPVAKIDPAQLPRLSNIYYPGSKSYNELPNYLSGWDIAIIPFVLNESTKFISPTKTPEYLAAGKRVISTSIADVVEPYGNNRLVQIADDSKSFISAAETALNATDTGNWLNKVDRFLEGNSWDITWHKMNELIEVIKIKKKKTLNILKQQEYV